MYDFKIGSWRDEERSLEKGQTQTLYAAYRGTWTSCPAARKSSASMIFFAAVTISVVE